MLPWPRAHRDGLGFAKDACTMSFRLAWRLLQGVEQLDARTSWKCKELPPFSEIRRAGADAGWRPLFGDSTKLRCALPGRQ